MTLILDYCQTLTRIEAEYPTLLLDGRCRNGSRDKVSYGNAQSLAVAVLICFILILCVFQCARETKSIPEQRGEKVVGE